MLNNSFFKIIENPDSGKMQETFSVKVKLDSRHAVYEGHFPDNPVAPGVCLIQMIQETLEESVGKKLALSSSDNIKFLAIVNPVETSELTISYSGCRFVNETTLQASATVASGDKIFIKCKNTWQVK